MILTPETVRPGSVLARLLRALGAPERAGADTLVLCPAPGEPAPDVRGWLARHAAAGGPRLLVITRLGTHPDAASPRLRECWELEEAARATGLPTLVLRLGPLLGPQSPFWLWLRGDPRLPRGGAKLLDPVAETDAVETLARALDGRAAWEGWYEVAGPEVRSLAELAALARTCGPRAAPGAGRCEPPMAELEEHRLAEAGPWLEHFGMSVRPLAEHAREWARAAMGSAA